MLHSCKALTKQSVWMFFFWQTRWEIQHKNLFLLVNQKTRPLGSVEARQCSGKDWGRQQCSLGFSVHGTMTTTMKKSNRIGPKEERQCQQDSTRPRGLPKQQSEISSARQNKSFWSRPPSHEIGRSHFLKLAWWRLRFYSRLECLSVPSQQQNLGSSPSPSTCVQNPPLQQNRTRSGF